MYTRASRSHGNGAAVAETLTDSNDATMQQRASESIIASDNYLWLSVRTKN